MRLMYILFIRGPERRIVEDEMELKWQAGKERVPQMLRATNRLFCS